MRDLQGAFSLIASSQNFTSSWADLGSPIAANTLSDIGLWLNIDINDGSDLKVRALAKKTIDDTDEYSLPLIVLSAGEEGVYIRYKVLEITTDTNIIIATETSNLVPFIQFQIMADTPGATPAAVTKAEYTTCQIGA